MATVNEAFEKWLRYWRFQDPSGAMRIAFLAGAAHGAEAEREAVDIKPAVGSDTTTLIAEAELYRTDVVTQPHVRVLLRRLIEALESSERARIATGNLATQRYRTILNLERRLHARAEERQAR